MAATPGRFRASALEDLNQFQDYGSVAAIRTVRVNALATGRPDWASFTGNFESSKTGHGVGPVRSVLTFRLWFSGVWQLRLAARPDVDGQATLVQTGQPSQGYAYIDSEGHTV